MMYWIVYGVDSKRGSFQRGFLSEAAARRHADRITSPAVGGLVASVQREYRGREGGG